MRTKRFLSIAMIVCLSAAGQNPPARTAPPETGIAKFTANTNLVIVDVTVKDKSGKPIEGLKAENFVVREDGAAQKISVFEFQKLSEDLKPPEPLSLKDQLKLPEEPVRAIKSEQPGTVQYRNKRLMVFYFDFSAMGMPEQLRAQTAALEYLDKKITKDDMVSVLLYTSTVNVLTDFTDDRNLLTGIVKGLPIGEMAEMAGLADTGDENGEDTGAAFVADESEFNIFNTDRKLAAIEKASRMLASLPEKKALLYFSAGVSKTGVDNQAQLEATVNASMKANVAIYPVDTRGLTADPPGGDATKGGSRGSGNFNGSAYNSQRSQHNSSQETLMTLAADTGGKAFVDSNDLTAGIVQAQLDLKSYYVIGYYSSNSAEDGRYRKISVKLAGDVTAKLEHRPGYFASKVWTKMTGQDREQQLKEALSAGDPLTDLPLALQIDYFRISPTAYFVPVSVKIPGSVVALAAKGGASSTQLDFAGQIQDERKTVAGNVRDNIKVKLDADSASKAARRSFQYDAGFTLGPGRYRMKFVVRENVSGKMGTFEAKFVIPDLSAETSGLKLSSIIWSSQSEPISKIVGAADKFNRKEVAANPLIIGERKLVPNITRVFRRKQDLFVNFDVYDALPDPASRKSRRVLVSMSLFNPKGEKAFEVGPLEAKELIGTRPEAVPVHIQVPLKDLAPGRYVCQLNVVDEVGRKFAFPRAPLVIQ
ncbi:MAG: VWA domain-containing protein [Candidatus Solibacter usitatus]|nr:VWA domain-containing protein [Candidatus Solibacter usitatus]